MRLSDLARWAETTVSGSDEVVTGVVFDSRQVKPGDLFVAVPGERADAHDFVADALAAGAVGSLVTKAVPGPHILVADVQAAIGQMARGHLAQLRAAGPLTVIGITGSVGKTTTKDMLGQVLSGVGPTVWPLGSFNNEYGLPATVLRADAHTRYLVLEMGANAIGDLTYLTDIAPPDVAVVLAVGSAHSLGFGGIENTARAKSELITGLAPGGVAVLNADDPRVAAMAALAPAVRTFGQGTADVRAADIDSDEYGRPTFTLHSDGRDLGEVQLGFVGEHNIYNALAAVAAAEAAGVDDLARRISDARPASPHRMALTERADGVTILDDSYNANPDSMSAALRTLAIMARTSGRRSVAVVGEMLELGEESVSAHDAIGRLAVRLDIGLLVVVGAGAAAIATGAQHEGSWGDEVRFVRDLDTAEEFLHTALQPGDIVLLKSSRDAGLLVLADRLTGAGA